VLNYDDIKNVDSEEEEEEQPKILKSKAEETSID
jgi:hypothetical protein